jgi:hypothetical protein
MKPHDRPHDLISRDPARQRRLNLPEIGRINSKRGLESGDRVLQRAAQLQSKTRTAPACPLRSTGRWTICRWHALDQTTLQFLSSCRGAQSRFSRQVPRRTQACLSYASGFHRHVRYALCGHPIGHRQEVPGSAFAPRS